jgi:hypothetical protein
VVLAVDGARNVVEIDVLCGAVHSVRSVEATQHREALAQRSVDVRATASLQSHVTKKAALTSKSHRHQQRSGNSANS